VKKEEKEKGRNGEKEKKGGTKGRWFSNREESLEK